MEFEWDPEKATANLRKHDVAFDSAAQIFTGPVLVSVDERRDYGEQRLVGIGEFRGEVLAVVYTVRDEHHRLISARKAGRHEKEAYRAYVSR